MTDFVIRGKRLYIFQREEGWYPVELADDDEARRNAEHNPGTLRVENLDGSRVIWTAPDNR